ncbi:MAG: immunoglobulin domain-containing protein [Chitinivibrionales bacterium]|nr:immunoglobulin domain-containing protein [Chitinivibrionales bacterium]
MKKNTKIMIVIMSAIIISTFTSCNKPLPPIDPEEIYGVLCHDREGIDSLTNSDLFTDGDSLYLSLRTSLVTAPVYAELTVNHPLKGQVYKFSQKFTDSNDVFSLGCLKFDSTGSYVFKINADVKDEPVFVNHAIVKVNARKPLITTPFKKITLTGMTIIGNSAILSITAIGSKPLIYQWYKDKKALTSATEAQFKIDRITMEHNGQYQCIVSNVIAADTSLPFKFVAETSDKFFPPTIVDNKVVKPSGTPAIDSTLVLTINATGTEPIRYQWYKDMIAISAATSNKLTFIRLKKEDEGAYTCQATNDYGSDTSVIYALKFIIEQKAPKILDGKLIKVNGTIAVDSAIKLSVNATGTAPLQYSWFKGISLLSTTALCTLSLQKLSKNDEGTYNCIVSNAIGRDTSLPYLLQLLPPNQGPKWFSDSLNQTVKCDSTFTLNLLPLCSDPNNDTITFKLLTQNPTALIISPAKVLTWKTTKADTGKYAIKIEASDGKAADTLLLNLTVFTINQKPTFLDGKPQNSYQINEGDPLKIDISVEDADKDSLRFFIDKRTTLPRIDSFIVKEKAVNEYQAQWNSKIKDGGSYVIMVGVTDRKDTTFKKIDVGIGGVNLPPQIWVVLADGKIFKDAAQFQVKEGETLKFTAQVSDPNGSPVKRLAPEKGPQDAKYTLETGEFSYKPDSNVSSKNVNKIFKDLLFCAADTATPPLYDTIKVTITVQNVNRPPVVDPKGLNQTVNEGEKLTFRLPISDPDNDTIYYRISKTPNPKHGTLVENKNLGEFTFTPFNLPSKTIDSLVFVFSDSQISIAPNEAVLVITTNAINQSPVVSKINKSLKTIKNGSALITIEASDDNEDQVKWVVQSGAEPKKGKFFDQLNQEIKSGSLEFKQNSYTVSFFYKPLQDMTGEDQFTIYLEDKAGLKSELNEVQVTITE